MQFKLRPLQQKVAYVKAKFLPIIALYESVFLPDDEVRVAVKGLLLRIVGVYEGADAIYEKLLLKAEAQQIAFISR